METPGEDPSDHPEHVQFYYQDILTIIRGMFQPTVSPKGLILEIIASCSGVTAPVCDTAAENIDKAPAPLGGTYAVLFIAETSLHILLVSMFYRFPYEINFFSKSVFLLFILFQKSR